MSAQAQEIMDAIRAAFAGVQRGTITLHEAEVIDAYGTAKARTAARRSDTEARWEDIPDAHVEACGNALHHLDSESWRYYLPRYMEWTLTHGLTRPKTRALSDHTIYALLFSDDKASNDQLRERFKSLNAEQSRAVARFLTLMSKESTRVDAARAADALRMYWHKFVD